MAKVLFLCNLQEKAASLKKKVGSLVIYLRIFFLLFVWMIILLMLSWIFFLLNGWWGQSKIWRAPFFMIVAEAAETSIYRRNTAKVLVNNKGENRSRNQTKITTSSTRNWIFCFFWLSSVEQTTQLRIIRANIDMDKQSSMHPIPAWFLMG